MITLKNKGFTLIELLAVIVVLSVVAVIVTPHINGFITSVRNKAFESSVAGVVRAVRNDSSNVRFNEGDYRIFNGQLRHLNRVIPVKGKVLGEGVITVTEDGQTTLTIKDGSLCAIKEVDDPDIVYSSGPCPIKTIPSLVDYSWFKDLPVNTTITNAMLSTYEYIPIVIGTGNRIILDTNPWGQTDYMWRGEDNATSSDGGFMYGSASGSRIPIDNLKTYRMSVWVKKNNTAGSVGIRDAAAYTATNVAEALTYVDGTGASLYPTISLSDLNQWELLVYYLYPYHVIEPTTAQPSIYRTNGTVVSSVQARKSTSTSAYFRYYVGAYATTSSTGYAFYYRPRIDVVDGTEPTIADLLAGQENSNLYHN